MALGLDFEKYKSRLKEYLHERGVDVSKSPTQCFNQGAHKHGDAKPSLQIKDDNFLCFGCGIKGDIYDAVELLEGITDKKEQYNFVERFFGGMPVSKIEYNSSEKKEEFTPDYSEMPSFENFLRQNVAAKDQVKKFLCERAERSVPGVAAYPPDVEKYIVEQFFYWPGLDEVLKYQKKETLKKLGIPLVNNQTGYSTWGHSGVVMKLGTGYKLHYYMRHYCDNCKKKEICKDFKRGGSCVKCEKINSKSGKAFPMPGTIDPALPVILVEGEMDALSCAAIGIKNVFATGGINGLTGPKVKTYLLNVPEIILFFDADEAGRKASGIGSLDENDARKTNIPQTILRAGYTGKIKVAELPPISETGYDDQDALIIAGKRDIVTAALSAAREYTPPPPPPKKVYTPFDKFKILTSKRLQVILKKIDIRKIERKDILPFVSACIVAFPHAETKDLLKKWGATNDDINKKTDVSPYTILPIIEKYLSPYLVREIEREITPIDEIIKTITIQKTKFELDFEEIEISQNARNFFYTGSIRAAALMLADIFTGKIIYNDAKNDKRFYFYDGHIWQYEPDMAGVIYNTLLSVLVHFSKHRAKNKEPSEIQTIEDEEKGIYKLIADVDNPRNRTDIEREFRKLKAEGIYKNSDDIDTPFQFDGDCIRETLTLQDCVLDMSGDKIVYRKSHPEEYRRSVLPYTEKQVRNMPAKYFWEFMRGNFEDESTLETFMYYLSLIGSRMQYKYGAFLIGGKDTGKSTTITMIEGVYKYLIGSMETDVLLPKGRTFATGNGPTPYIAQLEGLCASITAEPDEGASLNAGIWKKLTGLDTIPARGLNEAPKKFINTAQIIIVTNVLPRFDKHDTAVVERMVVIPFLINHARDGEKTKNSKDIKKALEAENPAILRVLAEYYIRFKKEHHGIIPISKLSNSYKMEVIAEAETDLDKFVNVNITFEKGKTEVIKDVYEKYLEYFEADENSVKRGELLSRIRFTKFIIKNYKEFVYESIQRVSTEKKSARVFIGMRLKTIDEIIKAEEEKNKSEKVASTQVPPKTTPAASTPAEPPEEDEVPF